MSNISYCRFQNTLRDLRDCMRALQQGALDADALDIESDVEPLSDDEREAAHELIALCADVAKEFADELSDGRRIEPFTGGAS